MARPETKDADLQDGCTAGDAGIAVMLDTAGIDRTALKNTRHGPKPDASTDTQEALLAAARSIY